MLVVDEQKAIANLSVAQFDAIGKARLGVGDDAHRAAGGQGCLVSFKQGAKGSGDSPVTRKFMKVAF